MHDHAAERRPALATADQMLIDGTWSPAGDGSTIDVRDACDERRPRHRPQRDPR